MIEFYSVNTKTLRQNTTLNEVRDCKYVCWHVTHGKDGSFARKLTCMSTLFVRQINVRIRYAYAYSSIVEYTPPIVTQKLGSSSRSIDISQVND